jgi:hypothetical protein
MEKEMILESKSNAEYTLIARRQTFYSGKIM